MLSLTAMFELNVMWVISCLDVVAAMCNIILGTYLERSEQTEKMERDKTVKRRVVSIYYNSTLA